MLSKKPIDLSEVQDFSTKRSSDGATKGKLDDMLTKLMKKNNSVSFFKLLFVVKDF